MTAWIGVDLDGTLVTYDRWKDASHLGAPILPMVARVRGWLDRGTRVRIVTARVYLPPSPSAATVKAVIDARMAIAELCVSLFGRVLPITCEKDYGMIRLYDDRAVTVLHNDGRTLQELADAYIAALHAAARRVQDAWHTWEEDRDDQDVGRRLVALAGVPGYDAELDQLRDVYEAARREVTV